MPGSAMQKIVFVTQSLVSMGGVVRVITNWSNYFAKRGYDVENVSVIKGKPYFELDERVKFTIVGFKFKYKIFKILDLFYNTFKMYGFLKERQNANIIFNKSLYIEPVWILRSLGLFKNTNLIYVQHGGTTDFRDYFLNRIGTKHRLYMIFSAFDKVVSLYDNEPNYPPQIKKEKLFFIANPLTFELSSIDLAQKENIVLSLGRVTKDKGIDTLIRAWNKIKNSVPGWKLQVVGEGEDKESFIKLAQDLDIKNIEFLPGTSSPKIFFERAKLFTIPSKFEGLGMVILEGFACKTCVVSSKTCGGLYLIEENRGELFEIGGSDELSQKLLKLISNDVLREKKALGGYEFAKNFSIEHLAKNWDKVLE
ncbi:MAG: glycosyltransferase [Helicobacteraceae bacterium]